MEITFYCPNVKWTEQLNADLANEVGKFFLVTAEYQGPGVYNQEMDECHGLDIAKKLNPKEAPIILCSMLDESHFIELGHIEKFRAVIARKGTGFLRLPFTATELLVKYNELLNEEKEEDTLAIEIEKNSAYHEKMGKIEHAIGYKFRKNELPATEASDAIKQAREIGVNGTDEEVLNTIINFKREIRSTTFSGKYFSGIFCDIEGTLIKNSEVSSSMLETLHVLALSKPITLWTGGDLKEIQKILLKNNITWKLVSKNDFAGAEVETAYDDEDEEFLQGKYGFKIRNFVKI